MKYLDEFRDPVAAKTLVDQIKRRATQTWTIMEVCGGQTHSIIRNGIVEGASGLCRITDRSRCLALK